jgi:hypothetical protein
MDLSDNDLLELRAFAASLLGVTLVFVPGRTSDSPATSEYKVKGNHIFNLAKFIEWPVASLSGAKTPFTIAVMDRGEAAPVLEALFAGKEIAGIPSRFVRSR